MAEAPGEVAARLFRRQSGRAVAILARALGDLDVAEDAVQDAYAVALARWPADGVPDDPAAWVLTVARNAALDRLRRDRTYAQKLAALAVIDEALTAVETGMSISGGPFVSGSGGGDPTPSGTRRTR